MLKRILFIGLTFLLSGSILGGQRSRKALEYEKVYNRYSEALSARTSKNRKEDFINMFHQEWSYFLLEKEKLTMDKRYSAAIDALWDKYYGTDRRKRGLVKMVEELPWGELNLVQQFRLHLLGVGESSSHIQKRSQDLFQVIQQRLREKNISHELLYTLLAHKEELPYEPIGLIKDIAYTYPKAYADFNRAKSFSPMQSEAVKDLFHKSPDLSGFMDGHYKDGVRMFLFCRRLRKYPCMMIMKDRNNEPVLNEKGDLWRQPFLAYSKRGLPSYVKNGHTPAGVHRMDSVMPEANRQKVYGKYRRMILDFVPPTEDEKELKKTLPMSSHDLDWWRASVVARDVKRDLLRIHGTGLKSRKRSSTYFPFVPTSGCVASRERKYNGVRYRDQRHVLDQVMKSLGLEPTFSNEPHVKGLLYVIDLDDKNEAMSYKDIMNHLD
jgi:hypothetical protein